MSFGFSWLDLEVLPKFLGNVVVDTLWPEFDEMGECRGVFDILLWEKSTQ